MSGIFSFLGFGGTQSKPVSSKPMNTAEIQRLVLRTNSNLLQSSSTSQDNPLGLPSINWGSVQSSIGAAQKLVVSDPNANLGNILSGGLGVSPSSPVTGLVRGSASAQGLSASAGVNSRLGTPEACLNLQAAQTFIGQTQVLTSQIKDTFGFLFPEPQSHVDTNITARVKPIGSDGNISYKVAPKIPTLAGHTVLWKRPVDGLNGSVTAVRKSLAVASRMSFKLEGRNTIMSLLVSPRQVGISRSQSLSSAVSRSGFIVNPTGPMEFDINVSGTTAGFYENAGLSPRESYTAGYSNLLLLYNFFLNNGYIMDDEIDPESDSMSDPSDPNVTSSAFGTPDPRREDVPIRRINSMSYVTIEWQKWIWWGYFKSFKIIDTSEAPYTLNYEFTFRVCHETDLFAFDNLRGDSRHKPPVTGHVDVGYSAERSLAAHVVGGPAPNGLENPNPRHQNVILNNYMFEDTSSPLTTLDNRVAIQQISTVLTAGGFSLVIDGEMTPTAESARYVGVSPDGTCVDMTVNSSNVRTLTVVTDNDTVPYRIVNAGGPTTQTAIGDQTAGRICAQPGNLYSNFVYEQPGARK